MKDYKPTAASVGPAPAGEKAPASETPAQDTEGNAAVQGMMGSVGAAEDTSTLAAAEAGEDHEHEAHDPAPGAASADLDTDRPVGGAVASEVTTPLVNELKSSAREKLVLDQIEAARGDLDITFKWSDRGSYHLRGEIWLDRHNDSWFGTVAHELVHLATFVSGDAANATTDSRDEFVRKKMEDEINAQTVAYVACLQSDRADGGAGFDEFKTELAADPALAPVLTESNPDHDWAAVDEKAKAFITEKYTSEWTTSNTGENYYDYWGGYWDAQNP